MNTFDITLDLDKRGLVQVVPIRQGDKSGTTIRASIYDHGAAAATSGLTARFQMRLPNGTEYYRKAASLSGNVATVVLDEAQAASVAGRTDTAYFQLLQGTTVVASTESFTIVVLPDALADAEVAESYDSAIQDAIDALDAAVEQMPDMVEDVLTAHPEWTTTVQDGSVSDAKLYQGTDGILARVQRLQYRLANMLTATLPEGDVATASDAAKTPAAGLALYGRSTQDGTPTPSAPVPIVSVVPDSQGNISLRARGRNLASVTRVLGTINGVTVAQNADGSLTFSGTATAQTFLWMNNNAGNLLPAGQYTASVEGMATGLNLQVAYKMSASDSLTYAFSRNYDSSNTFTIPEGTYTNDWRIVVSSGATVNTTVRFQIQTGSTATAYQPYAETVTPIDLDGHELRSLPDGTRDELTVGADGHAVLVQRVGHVVLDGSSDENYTLSGNGLRVSYTNVYAVTRRPPNGNTLVQLLSDRFVAETSNQNYAGNVGASIGTEGYIGLCRTGAATTVAAEREWLASNPTTVDYPLATPVTIDLGYVAAVPLCGPDLTAQAIPTAPMQLTYERDLNATLARLESAIATLA